MRTKKLVSVSLAVMMFFMLGCAKEKNDQSFIEIVRENLFEGQVVGAIYQNPVAVMTQGSPVGGAVVGGATAALLGFGPIGVIAAAAVGADSEASHLEVISEEKLVIIIGAGGSTFHIEVQPGYLFLTIFDKRSKLIKEEPTGLLQLYSSLRPGQKIRVISSKPLGKFAKVHSQLIFVGDEKIPSLCE